MKEQDFINIIKKQIGTEYIGDDCAFLKDLGIVVTQDSLVEDVHFKMNWCTPYQLGFKAVTVNISDVLASGAEPKYVTIALSLPSKTEKTVRRMKNMNLKYIQKRFTKSFSIREPETLFSSY